MNRYQEALTYVVVPVRAVTSIISGVLVVHSFVTPVLVACWTDHWVLCAVVNYVVVFLLWCLHLATGELEKPYEHALNVDACALRAEFDGKMVAITSPLSARVPHLATDVAPCARLVEDHSCGFQGSGPSVVPNVSSSTDLATSDEDCAYVTSQSVLSTAETLDGVTLMCDAKTLPTPYWESNLERRSTASEHNEWELGQDPFAHHVQLLSRTQLAGLPDMRVEICDDESVYGPGASESDICQSCISVGARLNPFRRRDGKGGHQSGMQPLSPASIHIEEQGSRAPFGFSPYGTRGIMQEARGRAKAVPVGRAML